MVGFGGWALALGFTLFGAFGVGFLERGFCPPSLPPSLPSPPSPPSHPSRPMLSGRWVSLNFSSIAGSLFVSTGSVIREKQLHKNPVQARNPGFLLGLELS